MKIDGMGLNDIAGTVNKKQIHEEQAFEDILKKAYSDGDKEKLKDACKSFEGILMQMMYRQMKKTVPESEFLPKSTGREIFEDMLDDEMINNAKERGTGLADVLYRQLSLNMDHLYTVRHEHEEKE